MSKTENASLFGFLNIYKPKGLTSHDVVARLRKITKVRQIGHTGTLDPFATGVLPICIGKATRLIEYLDDDKEYLATVQFGKNTATYDLEGEITATFDKKVTEEDVKNALKDFEGEISQIPPIYSAIKVNGKKLYDYARQGQDIEIKPRKVTISKIELKEFDKTSQSAKITVACSKGTYIRSIAYDLGAKLGCGGYLTALERTKAGKFQVNTAIKLEDLTEVSQIVENLINPLDMLSIPIHNLSENERERVSHGMSICNSDFPDSDIVILSYGGRIYAIGKVEQNKILVKKVFEVL
ncbi:MAG: tRNA pseudouridine(55) synthase TruB [Candidatus Melainabacteria bacterium]|nr:MAG: tRNA pseudouridine(55) synthase TruB [Candidatus Melainabacteria bacterium]